MHILPYSNLNEMITESEWEAYVHAHQNQIDNDTFCLHALLVNRRNQKKKATTKFSSNSHDVNSNRWTDAKTHLLTHSNHPRIVASNSVVHRVLRYFRRWITATDKESEGPPAHGSNAYSHTSLLSDTPVASPYITDRDFQGRPVDARSYAHGARPEAHLYADGCTPSKQSDHAARIPLHVGNVLSNLHTAIEYGDRETAAEAARTLALQLSSTKGLPHTHGLANEQTPFDIRHSNAGMTPMISKADPVAYSPMIQYPHTDTEPQADRVGRSVLSPNRRKSITQSSGKPNFTWT